MQIEQFIMAYEAEQDRLRALLPEGFVSLRPGLRINAEIRNGNQGYVEFNTPVERDGVRGWLNIGFWKGVPFAKQGSTTVFRTDFLKMQFTGTGIEGGCPAERITPAAFFWETPFGCKRPRSFSRKEFCDCRFAWKYAEKDAHGASIAYPAEVIHVYEKEALTPENAARIPCRQVLGAYRVLFDAEA
ncbi:MAG: hypothetical protein MR861_00275 [Clostridiales bacterium]|nr:hypothetical protein [Clostridiales bacterium]